MKSNDPRVPSALEAALSDVEPAVRAASARTLGAIGTRRSLAALRRASSDRDASVADQAKLALRQIAARELIVRASPAADPGARAPSTRNALARVRYAIVLGEMRNRGALVDASFAAYLSERIGAELRERGNLAVFALSDMTEAVAAELERNGVPAFRIEGNITRLEGGIGGDEQSMRCEISLLLMDEPARTLRSMIRGAASSSEQLRGARDAQRGTLAHKAIRSAVHSALEKADQAIQSAARERAPEAQATLERPRRQRRR